MCLEELWNKFLDRLTDFFCLTDDMPAIEPQLPKHTVIKVQNYLVKPGSDDGIYLVYDCGIKVYRMMDRKQFGEEFGVTPPDKGHEIIVETIRAVVVRETISGTVVLGQDVVTCEKS